MTKTVIPAVEPTYLPVHGTDEVFPVRRVYCVGRNYTEHAREMGHDPDREPPFFFSKPTSSVTETGCNLPFPKQTENLHHEAELVVAIGGMGADISLDDAEALIWGYAAGNDLTRRDLQAEAKAMRRPWDMAKGFDHAAIVGAVHPRSETGVLNRGRIEAHVDGELRQSADLADMIWPVKDVLVYLSRFVTLMPGDLVMTGTPEGVGPIKPGQTCSVTIEGLSPAIVTYA